MSWLIDGDSEFIKRFQNSCDDFLLSLISKSASNLTNRVCLKWWRLGWRGKGQWHYLFLFFAFHGMCSLSIATRTRKSSFYHQRVNEKNNEVVLSILFWVYDRSVLISGLFVRSFSFEFLRTTRPINWIPMALIVKQSEGKRFFPKQIPELIKSRGFEIRWKENASLVTARLNAFS